MTDVFRQAPRHDKKTMLHELNIKDFAIIEDLTIPFYNGLNILTGETGAGKSIIIAALGLVLGERADTTAVREGAEAAAVSAVFDAANLAPCARAMLRDAGLDVKDELVVRRVVSGGGKGRAYINGHPVPQQFLKMVGPYLIDVSSQHSQQLLVDSENHLAILDQFANLTELKISYTTLYQDYLSRREALEQLKSENNTANERLEFHRFQLNEIRAAAPKADEDLELEQERKLVRHAAMLQENIAGADDILCSGGGSVLDQVRAASLMLTRCSEADDSFRPLIEELETAVVHVEEVASKIGRYRDRLNIDPARLEFIEERLYLLNQLKKKYGGTLDAVILRGEAIAKELDAIEHYDDRLAEAEEALKDAEGRLKKVAENLSKERKIAAKRLAQSIQKELEELDFKRTTFLVDFKPLEGGSFGPTGIDLVEFLFAPNIGEPLKPLARIASGGELSRVMLAIKQVINRGVELAAIFVFDEVDTGIGGRTAEIVGRKLKSLSLTRQVICITHLPQVACYADSHYRVLKQLKSGRTVTQFDSLGVEDRIGEIARMLGGVKVSDTTRNHAREMLDNALLSSRKRQVSEA